MIKKNNAESWYISTPEHSYAIFCITDEGDLMINSDWGMSCFAWRSFGPRPFKEFLSKVNESYWKGKMGTQAHSYMGIKRTAVKQFVDNVWPLFQILQTELKKSPNPSQTIDSQEVDNDEARQFTDGLD